MQSTIPIQKTIQKISPTKKTTPKTKSKSTTTPLEFVRLTIDHNLVIKKKNKFVKCGNNTPYFRVGTWFKKSGFKKLAMRIN